MAYMRGIVEVYTRFRLGKMRKRDHFEDQGIDRRIILK